MTPEFLEKAERLLNKSEFDELKKLGSSAANKLSPQTAAQFFALYIQGYTTYEIHKQNPNFGVNGWGLIARAKVEYDWDLEKEKHVRTLMDRTRQTVEKNTLEAVQFASDGIAVYHKLMGGRFQKYLQTGDEHHLGDFKDMTFRSYRAFVDLLQSLTTQDPKSKAQPTVDVHITPQGAASKSTETQLPDKPFDSDDAMNIIALMKKN